MRCLWIQGPASPTFLSSLSLSGALYIVLSFFILADLECESFICVVVGNISVAGDWLCFS